MFLQTDANEAARPGYADTRCDVTAGALGQEMTLGAAVRSHQAARLRSLLGLSLAGVLAQ
jgi:hypothetical protein